MKQLVLKSWMFLFVFSAGIGMTSCKSKKKEQTNTNSNTQSNEARQQPVEVAPDATLTTGVRDAIKDYSGVDATVSNGEVTLTGNITRERLTPLIQSVQALNPKKVNNNLTIKD